MWHLRKKKIRQTPLSPEEMQAIIKQELSSHDMTIKIKNDADRRKMAKLNMLGSLPKIKRMQLERYLRERRLNDGKK